MDQVDPEIISWPGMTLLIRMPTNIIDLIGMTQLCYIKNNFGVVPLALDYYYYGRYNHEASAQVEQMVTNFDIIIEYHELWDLESIKKIYQRVNSREMSIELEEKILVNFNNQPVLSNVDSIYDIIAPIITDQLAAGTFNRHGPGLPVNLS